jgi:hypothetical protein
MLPSVGYVMFEDVEHGTCDWVHAKKTGSGVNNLLKQRVLMQDELFAQLGIDVLDLAYTDDLCARLIEFFKRRMVHATLRYG